MDLPRTPSLRLNGKHALVTGGTRGIGLAAAAALKDAGAAVTIVARRPEDVATVAAALGADGTALAITDIAATLRFFESAPQPFDILFYSAGVSRHAHSLDITEPDFRAFMDLYVGAALFVS